MGVEPIATDCRPGVYRFTTYTLFGVACWDRTNFNITYLVGGLGIEPSSTALQAVAEITRLAHPPKTFRIVLFQ